MQNFFTASKKLLQSIPFIKGLGLTMANKSDDDDDNGSNSSNQKKPVRPMPASVRRKLEASTSNDNNTSNNASSASLEGVSPSSSVKVDRPMPASVRKKLETSSTSTTPSGSVVDSPVSTPKNKPMPASVRRKLETDEGKTESPKTSTDAEVDLKTPDIDAKSTKRPMPASARRKLENDESKTESPKTSTDAEVDLKTPGTEVKSTKRPMPASARRKLEKDDSKTESPTTSLDTEADSKTSDTEAKSTKRPMPASARRKLEKDDSKTESPTTSLDTEADSKTSDTETKSAKRPMPASVRRRMEEVTESENGQASSEINAEKVPEAKMEMGTPPSDSTKKPSRPMPASAKRKIEAKENESINDEKTEQKTDSEVSTTSIKNRPMPASARKKLEAAEKEDMSDAATVIIVKDENSQNEKSSSGKNLSEKNKINISLGGITFPKFAKPMPASERQKIEKQKKDTSEKNDSAETVEEGSDAQKTEPVTFTSLRSKNLTKEDQNTSVSTPQAGNSSRELLSLGDAKYACQYCGMEFYQLSKKNNHEKNHLKPAIEKKPKEENGEEEEKSKSKSNSNSKPSKKPAKAAKNYNGSCPHCLVRISNRKKLSRHVYRCGLPRKFSCSQCERSFKYEKELISHAATHSSSSKQQNELNKISSSGNSENSDNSINKSGNENESEDLDDLFIPIPNTKSNKSSPTESTKIVSSTKPKAMPKSVRDKLEKKKEQGEESKNKKTFQSKVSEDATSSERNSFKRKIDEVLGGSTSTSLVSYESATKKVKKSNTPHSSNKNKDDAQSRPMPASVKKQLNVPAKEEKAKSKEENKVVSNLDDVDDDECEVCHRVFSSSRKRQKHEKTVHFIDNPRNGGDEEIAPVPSTATSEANNPMEHEVDEELPYSIAKRSAREAEGERPFKFSSLPFSGECPICSKAVASRLKRHVLNVHFKGDQHAAMMCTVMPSSSVASPGPTATSTPKPKPTIKSGEIKPLKILDPGYQRTFKMYKTTKSKEDKKPSTKPDVVTTEENAYSDDDRSFDHDDSHHFENHNGDGVSSSSMNVPPTTEKLEPKRKPVHKADPKPKPTPSNGNIECKTCKISFLVEANYNEHVKAVHSALKEVISCRLCQNLFTQESDFLLHLKYKHNIDPSSECQITQSDQLDKSQKSSEGKRTRKTTVASVSSSVNDDNDNDPDYEDDVGSPMEVGEEEDLSEIAITSTFSKNEAKIKNKSAESQPKSRSKEMPCGSCNEKFHDQEELQKHELYFHNAKSTKMCPICGVYPTRLGRHMIAHENKTVRCSCAPCSLNFKDFSELLEHNLKNHPGPEGGGLCASKKPKDQVQNSKEQESEECYRCIICQKQFPGGATARRHVARNHEYEIEDEPAANFVVKVENKKVTAPPPSTSSGSVASNSKPRARPMPASVRAKLLTASKGEEDSNAPPEKVTTSKQVPSQSKSLARPMPASVRTKMEMSKTDSGNKDSGKVNRKSENNEVSKPRPMPASVRAKLMAQQQQQSPSNVSSTSEVTTTSAGSDRKSSSGKNRPMPASIRAKLAAAKKSANQLRKNVEGPLKDIKKTVPDPDVIDLDDDDDDDVIIEQDLSFPQPQLISTHHEMPSVPIDQLIEIESEQPVMRRSDNSSSYLNSGSATYQCKMCDKVLDSKDAARRHILRAHSEYGPEHTENLIEVQYKDTSSSKRKRSFSGKYGDDDNEEAEEEEVIIPRGTSRRPRVQGADSEYQSSSRSSMVPLDQWGYSCKLCGKRMETPGNVKRHISKAHTEIPASKRDDAVICLVAEEEEQDSIQEPQLEIMNVSSVSQTKASVSSAGSLTNSKPKYRPGPASKKAKLMVSS